MNRAILFHAPARLLHAMIIAMSFLAVPAMLTTAHAGEQITLNFKEADINTVIATVSEVTGRNFIVDPRVKGRVNVVSGGPMDAETLYETFLSILQVHGYAAVESGDVTKILPETNAKQSGGDISDVDAGYDDLITRVIAVDHVAAPQLVPILRPLVPQYGHLAAYAPSNMLIISDRAANVERLTKIIHRIDKSGDEEIEVITLKHADANEVVRILGTLVGSPAQKGDAASNLNLIADPRTNSILIGGDKSERLRVRALLAHLDTPIGQNADTQVIYLRYAKAENLAGILQGYANAAVQQQSDGAKNNARRSSGSNDEVTILSDEETNSLVINAPPKTMTMLRAVIDRLDIRRAQVVVEAIIAEVSDSLTRNLGLEFAGILDRALVLNNVGDVLTSAAAIAGATSDTSRTTAAGQLAEAAGGGFAAGGVTLNAQGNFEFGAFITAIRNDTDSNVLSTPTLVTLDNQEATISVGQEIPFITGQFTNTGSNNGSVNPFQTIERRDVGISLKVTPHVVDDGTVQMDIMVESSNPLLQAVEGASDLVIGKRTVETSVLADSGQIIVLGGLLDDKVREGNSKTPLLGDIPLLGYLFRKQSYNREKTNLTVFLRPQILSNGADLGRYSRTRYTDLRQFQQQAAARKGDDENKKFPLLPELPEKQAGTVQDLNDDNERRYGPRKR